MRFHPDPRPQTDAQRAPRAGEGARRRAELAPFIPMPPVRREGIANGTLPGCPVLSIQIGDSSR